MNRLPPGPYGRVSCMRLAGRKKNMPRLPDVKRYRSSIGVRIYRIAVRVLPDLSGRVYLLLGAGPPTLVDTGSGHGQSTADILAGLETVRTRFGEQVRLDDIRRILLTHAHVDHVGGLRELVKHTKAELGIHPLALPKLAAPEERTTLSKLRMERFLAEAGVEPKQRRELTDAYNVPHGATGPVRVHLALDDNRTLDGLHFIHTPGHAPGHVCIVLGDVLLSGDHILARTIPQQWPESFAPYTGLGHYLESLERIRNVPGLRLAMGGHEQVMHDVYHRIQQIHQAQMRRLDRVLEILATADHPLCIAETARKAYSQQTGVHAVLAMKDVAARVEYLHQRARLRVANLDELEAGTSSAPRYCLS